MKIYIITLITFLFTLVSYSQVRLGSTSEEIKDEFWEDTYNLYEGFTDDDVYYISIRVARANIFYYFDYNKFCFFSTVIPDDQGSLNYYVEQYNSQYVIISSTEWKMYSKNGIAKIKLNYDGEGGYYFTWSNLE